MKHNIVLTYQLVFESQFHIGTGLPRGLVDRGVARDANGYLYIPGATIKGILREKCEHLAQNPVLNFPTNRDIQSPHAQNLCEFARTENIIEQIFGSKFRDGTLFFDNAVMKGGDEQIGVMGKQFFDSPTAPKKYLPMQVNVRTRNCISRSTGTAVEKALFTSEYGLANLGFTGTISGIVEGTALSGQAVNYPLILLAAGLRLFDRIGGNKSVGMGKCQVAIQEFTVDGHAKTVEELIELVMQEAAS